ncbi:hypothetical protein, conserved [Trypanosoma brucei brucei TREU927]|uniref:Uncharacterized protein n=1 Tax=Trypanosoma brucei brucei (strain 927/4 GUTat10.1) TaxID=185431 RepID=Q586R4_TRYB2|nr:hypothetical protein, conserved [Trypanosoma brucei brucei TREU927]AAQ15925.1 hypothetical protein, conserved [Trypanosoma brucei brucei TREU927]AAX80172.1 hypothetical protein, conserved [Trypanosoma brucei]
MESNKRVTGRNDAVDMEPRENARENRKQHQRRERQKYDEESSDVVPSAVAVPHLLGTEPIQLTDGQRRCRREAEQVALRKERKYYRVNRFDRFIILLFFILIPSLFLRMLSFLTSEWIVTARPKNHRAVGIITTCFLSIVNVCVEHGYSNVHLNLIDALSGRVVCEMSPTDVARLTTSMWALSGLQLCLNLLALAVMLRISCRPTRSCLHAVVMGLVVIGILLSACILGLFYLRTKCEKKGCVAHHLAPPQCTVAYGWGYGLYVAALILDLVAMLTCICLLSYNAGLQNRVTQRHNGTVQSEAPASSAEAPEASEALNDQYLTAASLGIKIEGADDWVYDSKSDFFYSFKLDAFWDPVQRRYYHRKLKSWLATPDGRVELPEAIADV